MELLWQELTNGIPDSTRLWTILIRVIAATALVHGLTVVTRNVTDFEPTGVLVVDPWRP